ncbi:MAG: N-methyl-L-tryptophan oxidase [Verrucomicrobia bacterium]|nr:N-methyl-L-tryptophan oxidase [Verrucomicrobiota bacterium]
MSATYDVIIVGLGAMGSAAAYHLAKRGQRVLGIDRFSPPHAMGSSHGQTRIIREAYFEHPSYVPNVQRAYQLWDDLSLLSKTPLFLQTGGLMIGAPDSIVFTGAKLSAETHHLPHEILTARDVRSRFPALQPSDEMLAVLEPRAGILFPERCIATHLHFASQHGASLRTDEPVVRWNASADGVEVVTTKGTHRAAKLILSAGSWARELLPELNPPLTIERQTLFWFEPKSEPKSFYPERLPVHLWQIGGEEGRRFFYGFPDLGEGVKIAWHHDGSNVSPDFVSRDVTPDEVETMRGLLRRYLPQAEGQFRSAAVCLYTNTPDEHFWIDHHPAHPQVLIASPCSGHGFKFSSAVGEILSDIAIDGKSHFDLGMFRNRWW